MTNLPPVPDQRPPGPPPARRLGAGRGTVPKAVSGLDGRDTYPDPPRSWKRVAVLFAGWVAAWTTVAVLGVGWNAVAAPGTQDDVLAEPPASLADATYRYFSYIYQYRDLDTALRSACEDYQGISAQDLMKVVTDWDEANVEKPAVKPDLMMNEISGNPGVTTYVVTITYGHRDSPTAVPYLVEATEGGESYCVRSVNPYEAPEEPSQEPQVGAKETVTSFFSATFGGEAEAAEKLLCEDYSGPDQAELTDAYATLAGEDAESPELDIDTRDGPAGLDTFIVEVSPSGFGSDEKLSYLAGFDPLAGRRCIVSVTAE